MAHLFVKGRLSSTTAAAAATARGANTVMVFGSSTGVGKTVISAGLCRASLREEQSATCYIKPVQTGELDEFFIHLYANPQGDKTLFARTLYHWLPAMSPHLASRQQEQQGPPPPSDADLLLRLQREMRAFIEESSKKETTFFAVVETAGGVLSPSPTPTTLQADLYRSMRLPIILVADAKLGGITTTLTAFESLRLRGYTVQAIAMISVPDQDTFGNNLDTVKTHLERTLAPDDRPRVFSLSPLPPPQQMLHGWFRDNDAVFCTMLEHLRQFAKRETERMEEMSRLGGESVWWPFTQHLNAGLQTFIESAHGDYFHVLSSPSPSPAPAAAATTHRLIDGCASWWTQGVGHGNPDMALAIAEAAGRYGHVMFPSNLHPPAVQLARFMVGEGGPGRGWAQRVFFSDDGSTAMEVALKMALRLFEKRRGGGDEEKYSSVVITQRDSYHGDTLGTMNASGEESVYTTGQHPWWRRCGVSIDVPFIYYKKGTLMLGGVGGVGEDQPAPRDVMDVDARLERGEGDGYQANVESFFASAFPLAAANGNKNDSAAAAASSTVAAALVIEPLMLGAGGLKFVDPLFQKVLVQFCKKRGIPVVFDEVAVGMWRLGPVSTISILKEFPDVAAYGKMLTGGYLPMALTLATEETFASFLGSNRRDALLHGHSYTANPLGCAAALEAVRIFESSANFDSVSREMAPSFTPEEIAELSKLAGVENAMGMGSVLSVALSSPAAALKTVSLMRADGVYARPLGSVVYVMPAPVTADAVRRRLIRVLTRCITKAYFTKATSAGQDVVV